MGIFTIRDLITLACDELKYPSVLEFGNELPYKDENHMASIAPVVCHISWGVFDQSNSNIPYLHRPPVGVTRLPRVFDRRDFAPVAYLKRDVLDVHAISIIWGSSICARRGAYPRATG